MLQSADTTQQKIVPRKTNFHSSEWLSDFIDALPEGAHLKDAGTGKYILSNRANVEPFGLRSEKELIGLTAYELFSKDGILVRSNRGADIAAYQEVELKRCEALEHQVKSTGGAFQHQGAPCLNNGFVQFEDIVKVPLFNRDHTRIIAILTYYQNVTYQYGVSRLFPLYRQYYPDVQAIWQLSKYLKIDRYFTKQPTLKEMQILLALGEQANRKKVARRFNISSYTLASHLQHLKDKLIVPDLDELLAHLRRPPLERKGAQ